MKIDSTTPAPGMHVPESLLRRDRVTAGDLRAAGVPIPDIVPDDAVLVCDSFERVPVQPSSADHEGGTHK